MNLPLDIIELLLIPNAVLVIIVLLIYFVCNMTKNYIQVTNVA